MKKNKALKSRQTNWRYISVAAMALFFLGWGALPVQAMGYDWTNDELTGLAWNSFGKDDANDQFVFQYVLSETTGTLESVQVYLRNVGSASDQVRLRVCDSWIGTVPDRIYCLTSSDGVNVSVTSAGWYTFTLPAPLDIEAGSYYLIRLERTGSEVDANYFETGFNDTLYSPSWYSFLRNQASGGCDCSGWQGNSAYDALLFDGSTTAAPDPDPTDIYGGSDPTPLEWVGSASATQDSASSTSAFAVAYSACVALASASTTPTWFSFNDPVTGVNTNASWLDQAKCLITAELAAIGAHPPVLWFIQLGNAVNQATTTPVTFSVPWPRNLLSATSTPESQSQVAIYDSASSGVGIGARLAEFPTVAGMTYYQWGQTAIWLGFVAYLVAKCLTLFSWI